MISLLAPVVHLTFWVGWEQKKTMIVVFTNFHGENTITNLVFKIFLYVIK